MEQETCQIYIYIYIYVCVIETRVRGDMLKCFAGSVVRNRIEGAIKKCREDPENLIRLGILGRIYLYIYIYI